MKNDSLVGRFWTKKDGKNYLGEGRIRLLRNINETGSISKAAKIMKMSYKAAWDDVDAMNKLADTPLVMRVAGGKEGGGTKLTDAGINALHYFDSLQLVFDQFMWSSHLVVDSNLSGCGRKNCFNGKISKITQRDDYFEVLSITDGGVKLISFISKEMISHIDAIKDNLLICLLPKRLIMASPANAKNAGMRNIFTGEVNSIKKQKVYVEVVMTLNSEEEITVDVPSEIFSGLNVNIGEQFSAMCQEFDVLLLPSK